MGKLRVALIMASALGATAIGLEAARAQVTSPPMLTSASEIASFCESGPTSNNGPSAFTSRDEGDTETCTLRLHSFDGTPLDVDITRGDSGEGDSGGRHKLIAMLHGFGGDKREYESKTDRGDGVEDQHFNSHWFAERGYYVINTTARGFHTTESPDEEHEPNTPAVVKESDHRVPATNNKIRLKSRESEIRDTQLIMQLTATAFSSIDPNQAAVTGLSYGGGESWVQASQPTFDLSSAGNPANLTALKLKPVRIQVAVPRYTWTDLAYGLAPNGHPNPDGAKGPGGGDPIYESSFGRAESPLGLGFPFGVPKSSYVLGFFGSGNGRGTFQQLGNGPSQVSTTEGPIDTAGWNSRVAAGDPFSPEDPIVAQARRGLTEYRSSYYQDKQWKELARTGRETAILSIQGWTDDLFPAVESFRQFKYLKRLDPRWPVEVEMADIGHPRAQNKASTWRRLNQRANGFLSEHIRRAHRQSTTVASEATVCESDGDSGDGGAHRIVASTPERLANGKLVVENPKGVLPPGSGTGDPDGVASDPVVGGVILDKAFPEPCVESKAPQHPGRYTSVSAPLRDGATYAGLGSVTLPYVLAGDAATVSTRVWDVAPGANGKATLMTRGTYRLDPLGNDPDALAGRIRLPLFGNQWQLRPGHRIRLDLMQVDESVPFVGAFQRSRMPDVFSFSEAKLELPTREGGERMLSAEGGTDPRPVPELTPGLLPDGTRLSDLLPKGLPLPEVLKVPENSAAPTQSGALGQLEAPAGQSHPPVVTAPSGPGLLGGR